MGNLESASPHQLIAPPLILPPTSMLIVMMMLMNDGQHQHHHYHHRHHHHHHHHLEPAPLPQLITPPLIAAPCLTLLPHSEEWAIDLAGRDRQQNPPHLICFLH